MKRKRIIILALIVLTFIASAYTVEARGKFWTISIGNIVISNGFTFNRLEHRKGKLLIEIVDGVVISNKGDGKEELPRGKQNYTYYGRKYKKGQKMRSVIIYNPETNWTDDILFIYDMKR